MATDAAPAQYSKPIVRLAWLLAMFLVIYLAYLLAHVTWALLGEGSEGTLQLPQAQAVAQQKDLSRVSALSSYSLFGRPGIQKPAPQEKKDAPKTRLRLALKGVFTGDQGAESGAIIEELGRSTDYYRIGDKVAGSATLEEVQHDRVLIRRNGQLETLAFEDKPQAAGQVAQRVAPVKSKSKTQGRVNTPEQFLSEATRRLSEDPESALRSVGLKANEGGGYVYQGRNPMLAGLNMKKGDVILSVNGHTLGDIQKDKALMQSLYEQGNLEVEVVRGGASFYINYPLR